MNAPGFFEWVFLGVLALLIFGPERLPKMAYTAGQMIAKFKREAAGTLDELKAAAEPEEFSEVAKDRRASAAGLGRDFDDLNDPIAPKPLKPQTAVMATGEESGPPPFDPDTP